MNRRKQIHILCRWLKVWRVSKKLSQEKVALATGIDGSNYEIRRCEPGLYNLMKLCDFYGLSLPWLLAKLEEVDFGQLTEDELIHLADSIAGKSEAS